MNKKITIAKKIFKITGWILLSILMMLTTIILLVQVPYIQNKLALKAASFISNKTNTRVSLDKINIGLPELITIKGLFLDDLNQDTLLYANKISLNIDFLQLIRNKIYIENFELENATVNLNRKEADTLFNYNFLITAFSDSTKQEKKDTSKSRWTFDIDKINLSNINFNYTDEYGGSTVKLKAVNIKLKVKELETEQQKFTIRNIDIKELFTHIQINESRVREKEEESQTPLPELIVEHIKIENSGIIFIDSINKQSANAFLNKLIVKEASADLQNKNITIDLVSLLKSDLSYFKLDSTTQEKDIIAQKEESWSVAVKKIHLDNNKLEYAEKYKKENTGFFDPSFIKLQGFNLHAESFAYSSSKTEIDLNLLSFIDANGFELKKLKARFQMDTSRMSAKGLDLATTSSSLSGNARLQFSSLRALKDSIGSLGIEADIISAKIKSSEIIYFSPELLKQPFFQSSSNITSIKGHLSGQVKDLKGTNISITTGNNTQIRTNFEIKGLPNINSANFAIPQLLVNTGKTDIEMIVGKKKMPDAIELPSVISLKGDFMGTIRSFTSTAGISSNFGSANIYAIVDQSENFTAKANINSFDLGRLLKNTQLLGPVSIVMETKGKGLTKEKIKADLTAHASQLYVNKYNYRDLNIEGRIQGQRFEGKITLNDTNAAFDFDGYVDLNKNSEAYKFNLDLKGADLKKLHLTQQDIRISLQAITDLKGSSVSNLNGKAGITGIVIASQEKQYLLDSLLFASFNEKGKSELNISSAVINLKYNGTFSPADIVKEMKFLANKYFTIPLDPKDTALTEPQSFSFELQIQNHPVLTQVLFPGLKEFEPITILGSFDSEKQDLRVNGGISKLYYNSYRIEKLVLDLKSNDKALNYSLSSDEISTSQIKLENISFSGEVANNRITNQLSSIDENKLKKLQIGSSLTKEHNEYLIKINENDLFIMDKKWIVRPENFISMGPKGLLINDLHLSQNNTLININSVNKRYNDDLQINIKDLQLGDISGIIEKDTSLVKGFASGDILLKKSGKTYGIIANALIKDLIIKEIPAGDLTLSAQNPIQDKFELQAHLKGGGNNVSLNGYFITKESSEQMNLNAEIKNISLKTVQALSMGNITSSSGNATGSFKIRGSFIAPEVNGSLTLTDAIITPALLNNPLKFRRETVLFSNSGMSFDTFTIRDENDHPAVLNGTVKTKNFKDYLFKLELTTKDFLLFNSTAADNEIYFGRMIIDSKIKISGDNNLPKINAKVKLKEGSNFTFAVPEKKITTDKGEGVVIFTDSATFHPIITRDDDKTNEETNIKGIDLSSVVEIDKAATLKLLIDPYSGDSLVVRGDAALSFALDPSGKMSLTGNYDLNDGSYLVSFESVLKRRFNIAPGSTIIWNGDPLDATVNINAIYSVRAAPIDLVADQLSGLSETEQGGYKQRYPFEVFLKLKGELLHPDISFEIRLPDEQKGILGGAVNAKLNMLNEDPSALNKQVFALLVLGRFIQEDPLQTETNAVSTAARTTVSKFLSAQLNRLSSRIVPGVELNFDVQSYDTYENGSAEGRTEVEVGIKKQLFNERLSVQVGGSVDVEGEKVRQNSASDITSDVTLEYKLTEDGQYRLKGFRHNQYEGAIEGQLVETGAGLLFNKDFEKWKELFRLNRKKKVVSDKKINNETISTK